MISPQLYARYYADPKYNGTRAFYSWLREKIAPDHHVLNLGAGPATSNPMRILKGEVLEVVGADIDPIVLGNAEINRAVLIENDQIPIGDNYFDVVFSDYVLEHVRDPFAFLMEVHRVLKPGGSFLFRTPNIFHYVTFISAMTPHAFHMRVANPARGLHEETHEPWPTFYRMNSRFRLIRLAKQTRFQTVELRMIEPEPSYLKFHMVPFLMGVGYERIVNATPLLKDLRVNILGCFRKGHASS